MIERFASAVDNADLPLSGKAFYSGRAAFSRPAKIYLLGLNPGGRPAANENETVGWHTQQVLTVHPDLWSAYEDESWENRPCGLYPLQVRVRHMLRQLELDPRLTPASNLIFVRSGRESEIGSDKQMLLDKFWIFHNRVIAELQPKIIVCLGQTAGNYVREKLQTNDLLDEFVERNSRRWRSTIYANGRTAMVACVTHPSIADWTSPVSDPTPMLKNALGSL